MKVELFTQPKLINGDNYSLGDQLKSILTSKKPKYTEAILFFGLIKGDAFNELFDSIKTFIINGGNLKFYFSQPQKGSMRKITDFLLSLGCEVFLFKNNNKDFISDFQYKGAIFNNAKKALLLLSSGNFTLSGIFDGYNTVTSISYDFKQDKDIFDQMLNGIFPKELEESFIHITRDNFSEIYTDDIPTIEEFTHKDIENKPSVITEVSDIDIEIDKSVNFLEQVIEFEKPQKSNNICVSDEKLSPTSPIEAIEFESTKYYIDDDALDIENMLFESSNKKSIESPKKNKIDLPTCDTPSEEVTEDSKTISKAMNLSKTSIFMLQAPKILKKGVSAGELKIPTYLRDLIPAFWDWPKEYKLSSDSLEKSRICTFKIIDTNSPDKAITDEDVKMFQKKDENSFSILSNKLVELNLEENDIIRFIKTQSAEGSYFTCEIIRKEANEYPIWEQFCTNLLKGSKRKYGMM